MNRDKNLNESATSSEFEGNMKPTSEKFIENPKFKAAIEKSFKLNTEPIPEESEEEVSWNDAGFLRLKSIGINSVGSSVDVKVKVLYSLPIRTPRGFILKEFFVTDTEFY